MSFELTVAIAVLIAIAVAWRIANSYKFRRQKEAGHKVLQLQTVSSVAAPVVELEDTSVGVERYCGHFKGRQVDIRLITDTLATRKLPSLWLMVTLGEKLPIERKVDCMFRPAGMASFSNFHLLEKVIRPPRFLKSDNPQVVVQIRSDKPGRAHELDALEPMKELFAHSELKEVLLTENGARLACLVAEADRARYGVLRQVDFKGQGVEANDLTFWLEQLVEVHSRVANHCAKQHSKIEEIEMSSKVSEEAVFEGTGTD